VWSSLREARRTSTNQIIPTYTTGMEFKDIWNEHKKILKDLIGQIEASTELIKINADEKKEAYRW
jgi:hypothetical protein